TCRETVPLMDGSALTAIEIQTVYLEQVEGYLSKRSASEEENTIVREWREALALLAEDPLNLLLKVDWVSKKFLLDRELADRGKSWKD
ncbi:proteasome accessory factor PafA2 family protein, partial [Klebsiella pneumoniae]|nr:proteasome accessory factor PafA2 family protein [Klebsiella pneumoniae]